MGDAAELVFVLGKTPPSSLGDTDVFLLYGTFYFYLSRYQDTCFFRINATADRKFLVFPNVSSSALDDSETISSANIRVSSIVFCNDTPIVHPGMDVQNFECA